MINNELISPKSIVVIGASSNPSRIGGKLLENILKGNYQGELFAINPKEEEVQGIKCLPVEELPQVDLAIIAVAVKFVKDYVKYLVEEKNTKAFIILSAGYSEENAAGKELEDLIVEKINKVGGALIGPNCTGVLNSNHHSIFTEPIPKLNPKGIDFISGSGATACFILESGIPKGLSFSSVYTVGNSAQIGVEEILEYLDESFVADESSKVKLLYVETISNPQKLLKHASSLIRKGCKIAAIKAGSSDAGSRAASSHTGALANSDLAVDSLFHKAGIVRCYGREELMNVAAIFMHPELKGENIAIITHAGGPAVMLTDALSDGGLQVPHIEGDVADELLTKLYPGSSVSNPIDFLATGTAEQLGDIIDYVDQKMPEIDGMVVIFGTPGLVRIFDVYDLLDEKMKTSQKPIYPVLPSTLTANEEVSTFLEKGRINFPDEVNLGRALTKVFNTSDPAPEKIVLPQVDKNGIRSIIDSAIDGYLNPEDVQTLLDAAGIARAGEAVVDTPENAIIEAKKLGYPIVIKVVGPVHKSDVGGVVLNVKTEEKVRQEFERMMQIKDTTAILLQPMLSGIELFVGAKAEPKFGHMVLCGLGGIFIEVLKDVSAGLAPIAIDEASKMIKNLRSYGIIKGARGQEGVNEEMFAEIVTRVSALVKAAPEIA
ncbi:MAG: acetate--CoA ligase family protein, partial [Candidatus Delongbacteria bacterium]|nr:acetate--CoA ligase family protein [Candidatus Delongbacteria bacterium]